MFSTFISEEFDGDLAVTFMISFKLEQVQLTLLVRYALHTHRIALFPLCINRDHLRLIYTKENIRKSEGRGHSQQTCILLSNTFIHWKVRVCFNLL